MKRINPHIDKIIQFGIVKSKENISLFFAHFMTLINQWQFKVIFKVFFRSFTVKATFFKGLYRGFLDEWIYRVPLLWVAEARREFVAS